MPDDEAITIVCVRVADTSQNMFASAIWTCGQCGSDILVAPATLEVVARYITEGTSFIVRCAPCVGDDAILGAIKTRNVRIEPEQLDEIRKIFES